MTEDFELKENYDTKPHSSLSVDNYLLWEFLILNSLRIAYILNIL